MMFELQREPSSQISTLGELSFDGEFICDTLEDPVRAGDDGIMQVNEKIYGKTAIPDGIYEIVLERWDKYGCKMPLLLNVPYYDGIRIHPGNRSEDTLGCILVGERNRSLPNLIENSQLTFFKKVLTRIHDYLDTKRSLFIEVRKA